MEEINKAPQKNHNEAAQNVRKNIYKAFESIKTFLLPHPGLNVTMKNFDGSFKNLDDEFKIHLKVLIESLFSYQNLVVKKVFSSEINESDEFKNLVLDYFDSFNSTQIPKVESIFKITARRELRKSIDELKLEYSSDLQKDLNHDLSVSEFIKNLNEIHESSKKKALEKFQSSSINADEEIQSEMSKLLNEEIELYFIKLRENILKTYEIIQSRKVEIEKLHLENNEFKKRLKEERKMFEDTLDKNAKKVAEDEKNYREMEEKQTRFDWMGAIVSFIKKILTLFRK